MRSQADSQRVSSASGIVMVLMTLVGWSSVPLFLKHFADSIDTWTSNGWRYGFSALVWAPVLLVGLARNRLPAGLWRAAIVPSALNIGGQVCFTWAFYKIDPGLVTFGLRAQIVFVSIGGYLFFASERKVIRTPGYIIGALMVISGVLATVTGGGAVDATHTFGVLLALGAGLMFAGYALAVRHFMHGMHPVVAFAAISQYTATGMIALMLAIGDRSGLGALDLPGSQFSLLLLSALIGIALGHVFYYASIARLGVAVSSGVIQLQPFVVTAFSAMIFGERLSIRQWIGGLVAIGGAGVMLAMQHHVSRRERATAAAMADAIEDQIEEEPPLLAEAAEDSEAEAAAADRGGLPVS